MELGEYVSAYRREAGITIDELASRSGVPKGTINKIIAGTTKSPTLDTVQTLARALGKSINDFLETPSKPSPCVSAEAMQVARDYDSLDRWGRQAVRELVETEKARTAECASRTEKDAVTAE